MLSFSFPFTLCGGNNRGFISEFNTELGLHCHGLPGAADLRIYVNVFKQLYCYQDILVTADEPSGKLPIGLYRHSLGERWLPLSIATLVEKNEENERNLLVEDGFGHQEVFHFDKEKGVFRPAFSSPYRASYVEIKDGGYRWFRPSPYAVLEFNQSGQFTCHRDGRNNWLQFEYSDDQQMRRIKSSSGAIYRFEWVDKECTILREVGSKARTLGSYIFEDGTYRHLVKSNRALDESGSENYVVRYGDKASGFKLGRVTNSLHGRIRTALGTTSERCCSVEQDDGTKFALFTNVSNGVLRRYLSGQNQFEIFTSNGTECRLEQRRLDLSNKLVCTTVLKYNSLGFITRIQRNRNNNDYVPRHHALSDLVTCEKYPGDAEVGSKFQCKHNNGTVRTLTFCRDLKDSHSFGRITKDQLGEEGIEKFLEFKWSKAEDGSACVSCVNRLPQEVDDQDGVTHAEEVTFKIYAQPEVLRFMLKGSGEVTEYLWLQKQGKENYSLLAKRTFIGQRYSRPGDAPALQDLEKWVHESCLSQASMTFYERNVSEQCTRQWGYADLEKYAKDRQLELRKLTEETYNSLKIDTTAEGTTSHKFDFSYQGGQLQHDESHCERDGLDRQLTAWRASVGGEIEVPEPQVPPSDSPSSPSPLEASDRSLVTGPSAPPLVIEPSAPPLEPSTPSELSIPVLPVSVEEDIDKKEELYYSYSKKSTTIESDSMVVTSKYNEAGLREDVVAEPKAKEQPQKTSFFQRDPVAPPCIFHPDGRIEIVVADRSGIPSLSINAIGEITLVSVYNTPDCTITRKLKNRYPDIAQIKKVKNTIDSQAKEVEQLSKNICQWLNKSSNYDDARTCVRYRVGLAVYDVDYSGAVRKTLKDSNGNIVLKRLFAERLSSDVFELLLTEGKPKLPELDDKNSQNHNEFTYYEYDRCIFHIDAGGYVTRWIYDEAGNEIAKLVYPTAIEKTSSWSDLPPLSKLIDALKEQHSGQYGTIQITHKLYGTNDRCLAQIDACGYVTQFIYKLNEKPKKQMRRNNVCTDENLGLLSKAVLPLLNNNGADKLADCWKQYSSTIKEVLNTIKESDEDEIIDFSYDRTTGRKICETYTNDRYKRKFEHDNEGRIIKTIEGDSVYIDKYASGVIGEDKGDNYRCTLKKFNSFGQLTETVDEDEKQVGLRYEYVDQQLVKEVDGCGRETWYYHDAAGRQIAKINWELDEQNTLTKGVLKRFQHSAFGELEQEDTLKDWLDKSQFKLEPGLITTEEFDTGISEYFKEVTNGKKGPDYYSRRWVRDADKTTYTDEEDYECIERYDAFGNVTHKLKQKTKREDNCVYHVTYTQYDCCSKPIRELVYEQVGNDITFNQDDKDKNHTSKLTTCEYNHPAGLLTSRQIRGGAQQLNYYDNNNRHVRTVVRNEGLFPTDDNSSNTVSVSDGTLWQKSFDAFDRVLTYDDEKGQNHVFKYVRNERTTEHTIGKQTTLSTSNCFGQLIKRCFPFGGYQRTKHFANGQWMEKSVSPDGTYWQKTDTQSLSGDGQSGGVTLHCESLNLLPAETTHDDAKKTFLKTSRLSSGAISSEEYQDLDAQDSPRVISHASIKHDVQHREIERTSHAKRKQWTEYDDRGYTTDTIQPIAKEIRDDEQALHHMQKHNGLGQLIEQVQSSNLLPQELPPGRKSNLVQYRTRYEYQPWGDQTLKSQGNDKYTRDEFNLQNAAHHLCKKTDGNNHTITYLNDACGNPVLTITAEGYVIQTDYNKHNQPTSIVKFSKKIPSLQSLVHDAELTHDSEVRKVIEKWLESQRQSDKATIVDFLYRDSVDIRIDESNRWVLSEVEKMLRSRRQQDKDATVTEYFYRDGVRSGRFDRLVDPELKVEQARWRVTLLHSRFNDEDQGYTQLNSPVDERTKQEILEAFCDRKGEKKSRDQALGHVKKGQSLDLNKLSGNVILPSSFGKPRFVIDGCGYVTEYCYNTRGQWDHKIRYANMLPTRTHADVVAKVLIDDDFLSAITVIKQYLDPKKSQQPTDEHSFIFFGIRQKPEYHVSANGAVTHYSFDGDRQRQQKIEFVARVDLKTLEFNRNKIFERLKQDYSSSTENDRVTQWLYDTAGRETGIKIDGVIVQKKVLDAGNKIRLHQRGTSEFNATLQDFDACGRHISTTTPEVDIYTVTFNQELNALSLDEGERRRVTNRFRYEEDAYQISAITLDEGKSSCLNRQSQQQYYPSNRLKSVMKRNVMLDKLVGPFMDELNRLLKNHNEKSAIDTLIESLDKKSGMESPLAESMDAELEESTELSTQKYYNHRLQEVVSVNEAGEHSFTAYDSLGRKRFTINKHQAVTEYYYEGSSKKPSVSKVLATQFRELTDVEKSYGVDLSEMTSWINELPENPEDRITHYAYDARGNTIEEREGSRKHYNPEDRKFYDGEARTVYQYDHAGRKIKISKLQYCKPGDDNQDSTNQDQVWQHTYHGYEPGQTKATITLQSRQLLPGKSICYVVTKVGEQHAFRKDFRQTIYATPYISSDDAEQKKLSSLEHTLSFRELNVIATGLTPNKEKDRESEVIYDSNGKPVAHKWYKVCQQKVVKDEKGQRKIEDEVVDCLQEETQRTVTGYTWYTKDGQGNPSWQIRDSADRLVAKVGKAVKGKEQDQEVDIYPLTRYYHNGAGEVIGEHHFTLGCNDVSKWLQTLTAPLLPSDVDMVLKALTPKLKLNDKIILSLLDNRGLASYIQHYDQLIRQTFDAIGQRVRSVKLTGGHDHDLLDEEVHLYLQVGFGTIINLNFRGKKLNDGLSNAVEYNAFHEATKHYRPNKKGYAISRYIQGGLLWLTNHNRPSTAFAYDLLGNPTLTFKHQKEDLSLLRDIAELVEKYKQAQFPAAICDIYHPPIQGGDALRYWLPMSVDLTPVKDECYVNETQLADDKFEVGFSYSNKHRWRLSWPRSNEEYHFYDDGALVPLVRSKIGEVEDASGQSLKKANQECDRYGLDLEKDKVSTVDVMWFKKDHIQADLRRKDKIDKFYWVIPGCQPVKSATISIPKVEEVEWHIQESKREDIHIEITSSALLVEDTNGTYHWYLNSQSSLLQPEANSQVIVAYQLKGCEEIKRTYLLERVQGHAGEKKLVRHDSKGQEISEQDNRLWHLPEKYQYSDKETKEAITVGFVLQKADGTTIPLITNQKVSDLSRTSTNICYGFMPQHILCLYQSDCDLPDTASGELEFLVDQEPDRPLPHRQITMNQKYLGWRVVLHSSPTETQRMITVKRRLLLQTTVTLKATPPVLWCEADKVKVPPSHRCQERELDVFGNSVATIDELGRETNYAFNDFDHLVTKVDPPLTAAEPISSKSSSQSQDYVMSRHRSFVRWGFSGRSDTPHCKVQGIVLDGDTSNPMFEQPTEIKRDPSELINCVINTNGEENYRAYHNAHGEPTELHDGKLTIQLETKATIAGEDLWQKWQLSDAGLEHYDIDKSLVEIKKDGKPSWNICLKSREEAKDVIDRIAKITIHYRIKENDEGKKHDYSLILPKDNDGLELVPVEGQEKDIDIRPYLNKPDTSLFGFTMTKKDGTTIPLIGNQKATATQSKVSFTLNSQHIVCIRQKDSTLPDLPENKLGFWVDNETKFLDCKNIMEGNKRVGWRIVTHSSYSKEEPRIITVKYLGDPRAVDDKTTPLHRREQRMRATVVNQKKPFMDEIFRQGHFGGLAMRGPQKGCDDGTGLTVAARCFQDSLGRVALATIVGKFFISRKFDSLGELLQSRQWLLKSGNKTSQVEALIERNPKHNDVEAVSSSRTGERIVFKRNLARQKISEIEDAGVEEGKEGDNGQGTDDKIPGRAKHPVGLFCELNLEKPKDVKEYCAVTVSKEEVPSRHIAFVHHADELSKITTHVNKDEKRQQIVRQRADGSPLLSANLVLNVGKAVEISHVQRTFYREHGIEYVCEQCLGGKLQVLYEKRDTFDAHHRLVLRALVLNPHAEHPIVLQQGFSYQDDRLCHDGTPVTLQPEETASYNSFDRFSVKSPSANQGSQYSYDSYHQLTQAILRDVCYKLQFGSDHSFVEKIIINEHFTAILNRYRNGQIYQFIAKVDDEYHKGIKESERLLSPGKEMTFAEFTHHSDLTLHVHNDKLRSLKITKSDYQSDARTPKHTQIEDTHKHQDILLEYTEETYASQGVLSRTGVHATATDLKEHEGDPGRAKQGAQFLSSTGGISGVIQSAHGQNRKAIEDPGDQELAAVVSSCADGTPYKIDVVMGKRAKRGGPDDSGEPYSFNLRSENFLIRDHNKGSCGMFTTTDIPEAAWTGDASSEKPYYHGELNQTGNFLITPQPKKGKYAVYEADEDRGTKTAAEIKRQDVRESATSAPAYSPQTDKVSLFSTATTTQGNPLTTELSSWQWRILKYDTKADESWLLDSVPRHFALVFKAKGFAGQVFPAGFPLPVCPNFITRKLFEQTIPIEDFTNQLLDPSANPNPYDGLKPHHHHLKFWDVIKMVATVALFVAASSSGGILGGVMARMLGFGPIGEIFTDGIANILTDAAAHGLARCIKLVKHFKFSTSLTAGAGAGANTLLSQSANWLGSSHHSLVTELYQSMGRMLGSGLWHKITSHHSELTTRGFIDSFADGVMRYAIHAIDDTVNRYIEHVSPALTLIRSKYVEDFAIQAATNICSDAVDALVYHRSLHLDKDLAKALGQELGEVLSGRMEQYIYNHHANAIPDPQYQEHDTIPHPRPQAEHRSSADIESEAAMCGVADIFNGLDVANDHFFDNPYVDYCPFTSQISVLHHYGKTKAQTATIYRGDTGDTPRNLSALGFFGYGNNQIKLTSGNVWTERRQLQSVTKIDQRWWVKLHNRMYGVLQVLGGTAEMVGAIAGTIETGGLTAQLMLSAVFSHGYDNFVTGVNIISSGTLKNNQTYEAVSHLTDSPRIASVVDLGLGLGISGIGALGTNAGFLAKFGVLGRGVSNVSRVTGAYSSNIEGLFELGLGKLAGKEVQISRKGLDLVEKHLDQFGPVKENEMMIKRLRYAFENRIKLTGADASFYIHEATEATQMSKFRMNYEDAHKFAFDKYKVSPFSVYHREVMEEVNRLEPGSFDSKWLSFWDRMESRHQLPLTP